MAMLPATTIELGAVASSFGATRKLYRDTQFGGNIIYREVSNLAEAVACGGVLFIDRATGATLGFIGDSLRAWLSKGGQSPLLTCVVKNVIDVDSPAGFRRGDGLKANPDIFQENEWILETGGDVAFAGIVTRAQTGFLSSKLHGAPFHKGVARKIELSSGGARYAGVAATGRALIGGEYLQLMAPSNKGAFAFMVTPIPCFASLKTLLLDMQKTLAGADEFTTYVNRAYPIVLDTFQDGVPQLRTIWAWHNGVVHHGPGGARAVLGTSRRMRAVRALHDEYGATFATTFLVRDVDGQTGNAAGPLSLLEGLLAPAESSTEDFSDDFREESTFYGVMPFAKERGPLGLPTVAEIANWVFELKDHAGTNTVFSYNVPNGSGGWTPITTVAPALASDFAADAVSVVNPSTYSVPSAGASGLAGVIGNTNMWEVHRHSLVGQYMGNDGTRKGPLRTAAWTEFLLSSMPSVEVFNCPPGDDFPSPEAKLAALKSNMVNTSLGVPRPFRAWQTWGFDVYDQSWYWVDEILRVATQIAVDEA